MYGRDIPHYPGFSPEAVARDTGLTEGRSIGKREGLRVGKQEGYQEGYKDGYHNGDADGWNEATRKGKQIIREISEEKRRLALQLEQLTAKLNAMERENSSLKQANQGVKPAIESWKAANARLVQGVAERDELLRAKTKEAAELLHSYTQNVLLVSAMKSALEKIVYDNGAQAQVVRETFVREYLDNIWASMNRQGIRTIPTQDDTFERDMPKTYLFMMDMLSRVAKAEETPTDLLSGIEQLISFTPEP